MNKSEYRDYISSPEWRERRNLRIKEGHGTCERCYIPRWLAELVYDQDLHVHHKHYRTLGNEKRGDLEVICRRCHEMETFGRSELRAPKEARCSLCRAVHWDYRSDLCATCLEMSRMTYIPKPLLVLPVDNGNAEMSVVFRNLLIAIGEELPGTEYSVREAMCLVYFGYLRGLPIDQRFSASCAELYEQAAAAIEGCVDPDQATKRPVERF